MGFRAVPAYVEYFTIKKIMENVLRDNIGGTTTQLRNAFDLKSTADYVTTVHGKDIDVSKEGSRVIMSASWTKKMSLFGNVSLVFDFDATVEK